MKFNLLNDLNQMQGLVALISLIVTIFIGLLVKNKVKKLSQKAGKNSKQYIADNGSNITIKEK